MGVEAHNIDLDDIGHEILSSQENELYRSIQQRVLSEIMSKNIWGPDSDHNRKIDRRELGEMVFNNEYKMERLNSIMHEPMLLGIRNRVYDKKGLIILNAALLAEAKLSKMCNNNVVLVGTSKDLQMERLQKRGLTKDQIVRRISGQWNYETKLSDLQRRIHEDEYGQIWAIDNSGKKDPISEMFTKVMCYFNLDQIKTK
jgi:dephospho-CoA kinase